LSGVTRSWTIFEQHCPQYDLNVLVHWLSFFEHHCLQYTDSSFNHLSLPPADLNTVYFPTHDPLYCLQVVNFSRSVEKCWCHSCKGFCKFGRCSCCLTIFLVLESTLIFQRSCQFESNCWNEIKEISVLEKIFWKSSFLVKDPTHIIQCNPLIVLYFENRNQPVARLK
jgi:hypothetical protein